MAQPCGWSKRPGRSTSSCGAGARRDRPQERACNAARMAASSVGLTLSSELESSMSKVQVEHKIYEMPPQEGFTVAHFLTVADIEKSARFYATLFEGRILSTGDNSGA